MGYEEQLAHLTNVHSHQEGTEENLRERKEKLIAERHDLVVELSKVQDLLKLNVDMDKQNAERQKAELHVI